MFEKLRVRLKWSLSDEGGQVLIIVLSLLALGSIMIPPLLGLMGSGYKTTQQVYNEMAEELYAADAGVRDAIWNVEHDASWLPAEGCTTAPQSIGAVNGKTVTYTVTRLPDSTYQATAYRIQSQGSDPVTSHSDTITCDVTVVDFFTTYTQNVLTSPTFITTKKLDVISGNVQAPIVDGNSDGTILAKLTDGVVNNSAVLGWPTVTATNNPVARFYFHQVSGLPAWTNPMIDISLVSQQGLYASGSPSYTMQGNGTLWGTMYVDGSLIIPNGTTIDLNRQTIFATGNIMVWPFAVIDGPGAIIAVGTIDFQPHHTNNQYIYIMSISSVVNFQPNSDFVGSVAGMSFVNLQPNYTIAWADPNGLGLNLPGGAESGTGIGTIENWMIQQ